MRTEVAPLTDREAALLVRRAGGTPTYAYSREALRTAVRRLRTASLPGSEIYYSLKANPHVGVVSCLAALVDGFDVCSLIEMETALNVGMPAERLLFTGPAKTRQEAAAALAAGVAVTIESPTQALLFAETACGLGVGGRARVRCNTPYPGRRSGDAALENQFGVSDEDFGGVVRIIQASPLVLDGLHLFWGSQYFDAAVIVAARSAAIERARRLAAQFDLTLDMVAVGGGIAHAWRDGDPVVDWEGLEAAALEPDPPAPGFSPTVVSEYGRSIVGPSGSLLTTVLDTKTIGDRSYVVVDAGMNHVAIAGRLVAGAGRGEPSVRVVDPKGCGAGGRVYVTGPLCSQLDVLAADVELPAVDVGDILLLSNVGAYGPSFSPSGFLSREAVREIVY